MEDAQTRWLAEDEQQAWVASVGMLVQLPAALDAQLQRDAGLTLFEYFTLSRLSMAPGHALRMSVLAELANGSLSRLSNVVKRLEQRGWISRHPDPEDGRYTIATLTASGWEVVRQAAPGHVEAVRRLLVDAVGPDDLETLARIARTVLERVQEERSCRPQPGAPAVCPPSDC